MEIKEIRNLVGMTQKEFGNKFNIPLATLRNWELPQESKGHRECPIYVKQMLETIVRYELKESNEENKESR